MQFWASFGTSFLLQHKNFQHANSDNIQHDDDLELPTTRRFRSAAPIVEIALQLHVSSASEKVGDYPPVVKVGDLSPFPPSSDAMYVCAIYSQMLKMSFPSLYEYSGQMCSAKNFPTSYPVRTFNAETVFGFHRSVVHRSSDTISADGFRAKFDGIWWKSVRQQLLVTVAYCRTDYVKACWQRRLSDDNVDVRVYTLIGS